MIFKKRLTIFPDIPPVTNEDICFGIAAYCAENQLPYEFVSRAYPVIVVIDGYRYEVTRQLTRRILATFWTLRCKETG